jgi:hypothetical protein
MNEREGPGGEGEKQGGGRQGERYDGTDDDRKEGRVSACGTDERDEGRRG